MDKGLDRVGVNVKHQKEKMVSCNFEGVAVMLAKQSGVAKKKLKDRLGNYLVSIHQKWALIKSNWLFWDAFNLISIFL